ncbi:hypothetical protein AB0G74_27825 [Streptomyces sp. NPDC020875]|uniref:hypothetical protein n=1 Tax=Streptomyces sp. NPDC020875 TaxID=3154898 RepID=UPI0033F04E48
MLTRSEIEPVAPALPPIGLFGLCARTRTLRQLRLVLSAPDDEVYDALEDVLGRYSVPHPPPAVAVCLFWGLVRVAARVGASPRLSARCTDVLARARELTGAVETAGPVGAMPLADLRRLALVLLDLLDRVGDDL